jgi:hypothetical protein
VIPYFTLHAVRMKWSDYVVKGFVRPIVAAIPAAGLCYAFSIWVAALSWFVFGLEVLAVGVTAAVVSYYVCLSPGQRSLIIERIRKSFHKEEVGNVVGRTV